MRPTELPELRARMADWMASDLGGRIFRRVQTEIGILGRPINQDQAYAAWVNELVRWRSSELFYATRDMSRLAIGASASLPNFMLRKEDIPTDHGLIYFDEPIGTSKQTMIDDHGDLVPSGAVAPLRACLWGLTDFDGLDIAGKREIAQGVWLSFYSITPELAAAYRETFPTADVEPLIRVGGPLTYDDETWLGFDSDGTVPEHTTDSKIGWTGTILAAWLLMQQSVATSDQEHADRAAIKRIKRSGEEVKPVRVITLRHAVAVGDQRHDSTREYHHRWVVRGHWRQQWYPSQQRHLPIWISPHVKGPEGAPLLEGEKVYAWTR